MTVETIFMVVSGLVFGGCIHNFLTEDDNAPWLCAAAGWALVFFGYLNGGAA